MIINFMTVGVNNGLVTNLLKGWTLLQGPLGCVTLLHSATKYKQALSCTDLIAKDCRDITWH